MRYLYLVGFLLLGLKLDAACSNNMSWIAGEYGSYHNNDIMTLRTLFNQGAQFNNCNRNYEDDYLNHSIRIRTRNGGNYGSWMEDQTFYYYLPFNLTNNTIWTLEDRIASSVIPEIRNAEALQFEVTFVLDAVFGTNTLKVTFVTNQVGNVYPVESVLCWAKEYPLSYFLNSFGTGLTSRALKIYDENPINTTIQPFYAVTIPDVGAFDSDFVLPEPTTVNPVYYVVFSGMRYGKVVRRRWIKQVYEVGNANFSSVPSGISEVSADVLLSNYSTYSGGVVEYSGNGVLNSSDWFFSPSLAGVGSHNINIRVDNQGCKSYWSDAYFQVSPIVSVLSAPNIDMESTFGLGELGANVQAISGAIIQPLPNPALPPQISTLGKYHAVCSDKDYNFGILSPNASLTYEWQMVYHNQLFNLGQGVNKTVSMPTRNDIIRNVYQGVNPSQSSFTGNEPVSMFINFGTNPSPIGTVYTGDMIVLMVRSRNVSNEVSPWKKLYLGLMPSPLLESSTKLCYDDNPLLVSTSNTQVYLDSLETTTIRSVLWDVDALGGYEYVGDSIYHFMQNTNKLNIFKAQVVDSSHSFVHVGGGQYAPYYHEASSEVCYSSIEDVKIIRKPIPTITFSEVGNINVGTPVLTVVSGSYFDLNTDTIAYQFSDGSMQYQGDSLWHYFNDLGYYSLNVTVTDLYGCATESQFDNYWLVPGVLSLEEEESLLEIYPVPAYDKVTIVLSGVLENVSVFDLSGNLVMSTIENQFDISHLESGTYVLTIQTSERVFTRKIMKL